MIRSVGPKEKIRDRLDAYREAGVGTLVCTPLDMTAEGRGAMIRDLAAMN